MTQPAKTQEPSMEEILASIRRIISDDEAKPAAGAASATAARPEAPKPDVAKAPPAKPAMALNPSRAAPPRPPPPVKNSQDEIDAMMAGFDGPKAARADTIEPAEDDVFELTEQMAMPELPASSFQHVEPDDDLEFTEAPGQRSPAPSAPSFATSNLPRAEMLSNTTVSAVESAFNALATTVLSNNARTLEDLVKEMLRPMLKSWLDDNLPNMVERIVKAEIERVSRGR